MKLKFSYKESMARPLATKIVLMMEEGVQWEGSQGILLQIWWYEVEPCSECMAKAVFPTLYLPAVNECLGLQASQVISDWIHCQTLHYLVYCWLQELLYHVS